LWLNSIQLQDYRNYQNLEIGFRPGITLLHGPNGEGKTNLVEAIYFASTLQSHRVAGYQNLISQNSPLSQITAKAQHGGRELLVGLEINSKGNNRYFVNGNQVRKASELVGLIGTVIFAPEDLDLVRRDPSDRRSFMDQALFQLKPRMAGVKSDYDRVLKQRNALLKSAKSSMKPELSTLEIWDDQLITLGVELIVQRLALLKHLGPLLSDFYLKLSGANEQIKLSLVSAIGDDDNLSELPDDRDELATMFRSRILENRARELERGITLVGPHRDELLIEKDGLVARSHASQGEAWSLALGLKLALATLLKENSKSGDPILLLDDVFAVLDVGRRARLLEFVLTYEQVIVTAADKEMAPELDWADVYRVSGGVLTHETEL
jgi:DNA replication and repair protein RecF